MNKGILKRISSVAQKRWNKIRNESGYTKEDAVIYALEVIASNGCFYDPTRDEYEDLIASII